MLSKQEFDRRVIESLSTTKYILPSAIVLQKNFSTVVYKMFEPIEKKVQILKRIVLIEKWNYLFVIYMLKIIGQVDTYFCDFCKKITVVATQSGVSWHRGFTMN